MYHIKDDKRARTSAELICAAVLELLQEKPFAKLTITDVQQRSSVSRSTFYRNFDRLEDVLELLCDQGFDTVFERHLAAPEDGRAGLAVEVFRYWSDHSAVLETLVQIHRTDILFASFRRCAARLERLRSPAEDAVQYDYFVSIITAVMIGVLVTWTEHGKKETQDQVLQQILGAFSAAAALGILGEAIG